MLAPAVPQEAELSYLEILGYAPLVPVAMPALCVLVGSLRLTAPGKPVAALPKLVAPALFAAADATLVDVLEVAGDPQKQGSPPVKLAVSQSDHVAVQLVARAAENLVPAAFALLAEAPVLVVVCALRVLAGTLAQLELRPVVQVVSRELPVLEFAQILEYASAREQPLVLAPAVLRLSRAQEESAPPADSPLKAIGVAVLVFAALALRLLPVLN